MATFLATLVVIGIVMGAMAVGLASGRVLKGSCGGSGGGNCPCTPAEQAACELKRRRP